MGSDSTRYDMLCPTVVKPRLTFTEQRQKQIEKQIEMVKAAGRERTQSVPSSEAERCEARKPRSGSLTPMPTPLTAETVRFFFL